MRPPRPKDSMAPPRDQFVTAIAHRRRKNRQPRRQRPRPPAVDAAQRADHPGGAHPVFRPVAARPIRHKDQRVEILRREPVRTEVALRRGPLQRRKMQPSVPIEAQQQPHEPLAKAALAVEEQHRAATIPDGRREFRWRAHASRSVGLRHDARKRKRRGRNCSARRLGARSSGFASEAISSPRFFAA